jgi:hypothetical protein
MKKAEAGKTKKGKGSLASRMEDFYFELKDPDGNKKILDGQRTSETP